ncbi:MAG: gamma carbonic anhydrase family protein [Verrucomicrobiota bacterium]
MNLSHLKRQPAINPSAFVAAGATIIGDVEVGARSSIWYQTVIRADINHIRIGEGTNIQDGCVLHLADDFPVEVGDHVTCGHRAILHACTIMNEVLIGMGAIIMDGCEVGEQCIIGAGTLLTKNQKIPAGSLVLGTPGRVVRPLTDAERLSIRPSAEKYIRVSEVYRQREAEPLSDSSWN